MDSELRRRLLAGPDAFPHQLDLAADQLLLIGLGEAEIAAASFLDERALGPQTQGRWVPMADIVAAAADLPRDDAQYIFHIGHVGSTLIARLLGAMPGVLALREPLVLRSIAEVAPMLQRADSPWNPDDYAARVGILRRLLARTFRPDQRAIVKATSFTSAIGAQLVAPGARAVLLHVSPRSYAETILAGDNSRRELALLAGDRLARLDRMLDGVPWRLWRMDEAARIALAWATEMLSLGATAAALPDGAALWVDFDEFLGDTAPMLCTIAHHFGLPLDAGQARALAGGPIMGRYAKAPEHAYTPELRRQVKAQARAEHAATIAGVLAWLDDAAKAHPAIAAALTRSRRCSS